MIVIFLLLLNMITISGFSLKAFVRNEKKKKYIYMETQTYMKLVMKCKKAVNIFLNCSKINIDMHDS